MTNVGTKRLNFTLREKCLYLELFWSVFSRIRTEYGPENLRIRSLFTQCQKLIERSRRKMDNVNFERDQKNFFKKVERGTEHVGQIPEMEKFVKFWKGICEKDDRTPEMTWIEIVSRQLREPISKIKEFNITEETLEKETKKRKNWTAPGINIIQNFWWNRLKPAKRELKRVF